MKTGDRRTKAPKGERVLARAEAESISLDALGFLAREPVRIERFFSLTGINPGDVRQLAREEGFQLAILDHLASDEALLLAFAEEEGVAPEDLNAARQALGGGDFV